MKSQTAHKLPRIGKSCKHTLPYLVKSMFHENFIITHHKSRRLPISCQPLVNTELKKVIDEEHFVKLNDGSDKKSITLIEIRRDKVSSNSNN